MSKMNELSQTVDELKTAARLLLSAADSLTDLFSGTGDSTDEVNETLKPAEPLLTLESVRAVLAEKSRSGYTSEVKALLEKYGATKLSEIDPEKYHDLLEEAKVLGNG
jgi:coenzyme F420-reducing hydrogenase alpha subunit